MRIVTTSIVGLLLALAFASVAVGAEPPKSHYEHLKGLEFMVGRWTGEIVGPDGAKIELGSENKWILNKNVLQENVFLKKAGKQVPHLKELVFWDPVKKHVRVISLFASGDVFEGRVTIDSGGKCIQEKSGWSQSAKAVVDIAFTFAKEGDGFMKAEAKSTVPGNPPVPLKWVFTFKRAK